MAHSNQNWVGGSFHNVTIEATPNEIISVLGKPDCEQNDGSDKCNFDWNGITEDGVGFTVYDWKEYRPLDMDELVRFHIGGKDYLETSDAKEELAADIQRVRKEKADADWAAQQLASGLDPDAFDALSEINDINSVD